MSLFALVFLQSAYLAISTKVKFDLEYYCYNSRLKVLSQETTLVLSNTRELDRVPKTK